MREARGAGGWCLLGGGWAEAGEMAARNAKRRKKGVGMGGIARWGVILCFLWLCFWAVLVAEKSARGRENG